MKRIIKLATLLLMVAGHAKAVTGQESITVPLRAVGKGHTERVSCGVFTPDSKTFLSAGADKVIRAWNSADGKEL